MDLVDTLKGSNRGLSADKDGNILYSQSGPSKIIKINYQTMEGMASHLATETGSSPTKAAAADDGTIFVGPVVGNGAATAFIVKYDTDLNFVENAVDGPPAIARTMEVSADGNTIYWTVFTGLREFTFIHVLMNFQIMHLLIQFFRECLLKLSLGILLLVCSGYLMMQED